MKKFIILFWGFSFSFFFFLTSAYANCQGCCSWHGGVVCSGGVTKCADGTSLSDTCRRKGCNKCDVSSPVYYTYYLDSDGDSYGNPNITISSSSSYRPSGYVNNNFDCNDDNSSIHPSATEVRGDGIDQDCDGSDLPELVTYYRDLDEDFYGDPNNSSFFEAPIAGYVTDFSDCNDFDSTIFPGATEIPDDGIDQDCNGSDLISQNRENTIKVANFNIQIFGMTKAGKTQVMDILARTITEFDIVAIQEIRDASGIAIVDLENEVDLLGEDYTTIVGPRLGRTSSKEQYAYMFRTNRIESIGAYTFDDSALDYFHREPLIAKFKAINGNFDFVLVTLHTDPDEATEEINALPLVVANAQNYFAEKDVIIIGDLNADCSYFDEDDYECPMRAGEYTWLIDNNMDTTLSGSSCTYDRIIILDDLDSDFTGKAGVYRFDDVYNLTEYDAEAVSDHYPIWAEFYINKDEKNSDYTHDENVSDLRGFDKEYYLTAKLISLRAKDPTWIGKTTADLETYLFTNGFTAESHYSAYGYKEGLEPNTYFNHSEYLFAKGTQMYSQGEYSSVENAVTAFQSAWPGDAYQHYLQYGANEGINPSNNFDENKYLTAKLDRLKAISSEWQNQTISDLRNLFAAMGMTVIEHYMTYGKAEGLLPEPVQ